jgi:hypothetical protein
MRATCARRRRGSGSRGSTACRSACSGTRCRAGRAWEIADELGWAETYAAEYIALTQLQGDAFVTLDRRLARAAQRLVATAGFDALFEA